MTGIPFAPVAFAPVAYAPVAYAPVAYAEVIGDPISHSKSPLIHGFWLKQQGIAAEYRACHIHASELAGYFSARRADPLWQGCNVTIPHKEAVAQFLDKVDDKAQAIAAVNTVYRDTAGSLVGTNTDVDGVAEAIGSMDLTGRDVCVIGAGGAARAAFKLLADKGCTVYAIARDPEKAMRVAKSCGVYAIGVPLAAGSTALREASLLINATQLGMTGQESMPQFLLAELAEMAKDALVFDMVYAPLHTPLLAAAAAQGLRTADGLTMLIGQAATAFGKFFGQPAPRIHDAQLRAMLTA